MTGTSAATLSIAADLMKIALPLVVAILWRKGERIFAFAGAVFWIGTVAFSICTAIGFATSTRGYTVAANENLIEARKAWAAKITRVERRLDLLGVHRPSNIIQAEIDSLLRTPGTDGCKGINGPVTQDTCPKVDHLRQELAASQEWLDSKRIWRIEERYRKCLSPRLWRIRNPPP